MLHHRFPSLLAAALLVAAVAGQSAAAEPRVELELAMGEGFSPTDARRWSELLAAAGFSSVRIRGGQSGDQPTIDTRGKESSPSYHVLGVLTADNKLLVPKARFTLADRGRLEEWLAKLRRGGIEAVTVKPEAFGLLPRQLLAVHEALAVPVRFSTLGRPPREAAKQIADGLSLKFVTDAAGQRAVATGEPIADELEGLSAGTALAAILRPLGLALVPEQAGGDIRLRIADSLSVKEHWPVGWPPKGNPRETLPGLFGFLNVDVSKTPVLEVLTAISGRVKCPFLIDHNSAARHGIDLKTAVDLPRANTYYANALSKLLFQAGLKYEIRIDEGNKPFLWVTTVRQ